MNEYLNKVNNIDARNINKIIKDKIVDVIITSPPYFDMKDYGNDKQIGYGQKYEEYLLDLKNIFKKIYNITKDTGSLWVVIDTFKRDNQIVPLPFDFLGKITTPDVGWLLQDIIIWNKNKTVPWSNKKQTRKIFEYILHFSKDSKFKYNLDKVREYDPKQLKQWWIKYPERYNPKGKAPDEIWNYDIPQQGSWGNSYIRHFCPLPTDMVARILQLTTNEGDLVLDPFAGSGAVLFQSSVMRRNFIGCELNKDYIEMFNKYFSEKFKKYNKQYEILKDTKIQDEFEQKIIDLRILKYPKVIRNNVNKIYKNAIKTIYVRKLDKKVSTRNKIVAISCEVVVDNKMNNTTFEKIKNIINQMNNKPPLSKFGVEPEINYLKNFYDFSIKGKEKIYIYKDNNTHKYCDVLTQTSIISDNVILSPIKVDIDEKDYI